MSNAGLSIGDSQRMTLDETEHLEPGCQQFTGNANFIECTFIND